MNSKGVIYLRKSLSHPDCVQIGYTMDIERRMKQCQLMRQDSIDYQPFATYETDAIDKDLYDLINVLDNTRQGKGKNLELFRMTAEEAYRILECIAKLSGTEDRLKRM